MRNQVTFYFDYLSPFSFFAWKQIQTKIEWQELISLNLQPIMLGRLLNHWGQKGPGEIAPKREYLFRALIRWGQQNGQEFRAPRSHPFNSLYALRCSTKIAAKELQHQVVDAFWQACWLEGIELGDPDETQSFLAKKFPGEAAGIWERSFLPEAKAEVKQNTMAAIEKRVFGVPSFITQEGELFWGLDSLPDLKNTLLGRDSLDWDYYKKLISQIRPSARQNAQGHG